jgi:hypothetical protein
MWVSPASWDTEWNPATMEFLRFSVATVEGRVYAVEWNPNNLSKLQRTYVEHFSSVSGVYSQRVHGASSKVHGLRDSTFQGKHAQACKEVSGLQHGLPTANGYLSPRQEARSQGPVRRVLPQDTRDKGTVGYQQSKVQSSDALRPLRGTILRNGGETGWEVSHLSGGVCGESENGGGSLSRDGRDSGLNLPPVQRGVGPVGGQPRDSPGLAEVQRTVVIGQNMVVDLPNFSRVFPIDSMIEAHDEMFAHGVL